MMLRLRRARWRENPIPWRIGHMIQAAPAFGKPNLT